MEFLYVCMSELQKLSQKATNEWHLTSKQKFYTGRFSNGEKMSSVIFSYGNQCIKGLGRSNQVWVFRVEGAMLQCN